MAFFGKNLINKKMKIQSSILLLALSALFMSCSNDDDDTLLGNWVRVSDFDGMPRANAAAFVLNGKGYLTTGYDGEYYYNDLWVYDPDSNNWTQLADFPGAKRSSAVGFATSTKGYVGTGYDGSNKLTDFYSYDPASNTWSSVADFPGTARYSALAFAINDTGYVGTGYDGNELKDFFKYNESSDSWETMNSLGGAKRRNASVFVIDGIAYVGFGTNNGSYEVDFWAFDPSSGLWERKSDLDEDYSGIARSAATAFTINGKGYISTGYSNGVVATTFEYDPTGDNWESVYTFEGAARQNASSFTIDNKGYVLCGNSGSSYFDDIREFEPNVDNNEDD